MTKSELIQAAKEIREICKTNRDCAWTGGKCQFCYFDEEGEPMCAVICDEYWSTPADWDIERLERESK